jgi:hypothetical protein
MATNARSRDYTADLEQVRRWLSELVWVDRSSGLDSDDIRRFVALRAREWRLAQVVRPASVCHEFD